MDGLYTLHHADVLDGLAGYAAGTFPCVVTSPPYNLKASPSGHSVDFADIAYEDDADKLPEPVYQAQQVAVLKELYRVCADGASLFYVHKDRVWDGRSISPRTWLEQSPWIVRQQITWDRRGTHNHNQYLFYPVSEWVFWLTKGRYPRSLGPCAAWGTVWPILPERDLPWHPCPFPLALAERCVLAGSLPGDTVLDPWCGASSTGVAALSLGRRFVGIDRQAVYIQQGRARLASTLFAAPSLPPPQQAALFPG